MKTRRRIIVAVAGASGLLALVGALHAPFARSLLARIGGCPVGRASAADIESARLGAVTSMRGSVPAPVRPALGFSLDRTRPEEVHAWAAAGAITCESRREGLLIVCRDVPTRAITDGRDAGDSISEVALAFRPADRTLVNVTAVRHQVVPDVAARAMETTIERLTRALGAPSSDDGDRTVARLGRGGYATSTVSYRFSDYVAEVSTTSIDGRGVMLREHHMSAR